MNRTDVGKDRRILVALSGGVDSSVAAALLKKAGYSIEGAYMRCWSEGPYCSADTDQADAAKVAATIGIPFHVFDFEKEYKERVIDYFYAEYQAGRTPNPDVMCNKEIKFGIFLRKARELGFDYIATGHYARIRALRDLRPLRGLQNSEFIIQNGERVPIYRLLTGKDSNKDQSYFLYLLNQEALAHTIFPLGFLTKKEVRKLAKKFDLPTAEKPDSTGICFVGPAQIKEFLLQKIKPNQGDIVSPRGKLLGNHIGLPFYTIGQREGLGISASVPYYVVSKDTVTNTLVAAPFGDSSLYRNGFTTQEPHWTSGQEPKSPIKCEIKLRYRAENVRGLVGRSKDNRLEVQLDSPQRAITPGQSAVFYDGDEIMGGAVIDRVAV